MSGELQLPTPPDGLVWEITRGTGNNASYDVVTLSRLRPATRWRKEKYIAVESDVSYRAGWDTPIGRKERLVSTATELLKERANRAALAEQEAGFYGIFPPKEFK